MTNRVPVDVDQGCYLAPACLTCHLPKCKEDMTKDELTAWRKSQKAYDIRRIYDAQRAIHPEYQQNLLTWLTAQKADVSRRTVQRALSITKTSRPLNGGKVPLQTQQPAPDLYDKKYNL